MTSTKGKIISRKVLSIVCGLLLLPAGTLLMAQPQFPPPAQAPPAAQPLSPDQLDNLVAPIALYPDNLLSQILVAATYPLEVVEAAQWLQQNRNLQGPQLVDAARQQNWDASIQALVVFPDVINRLNSDIRWTTDLGNAFLAQQADVMNAVQTMRARARQAGRLNSNSQEIVTTQTQGDQSAIQIQPVDPQVVYVPVYNPEYIWGPPAWGYYPPLYYPAIGFGFGFGPGIYIGSFFGGLGWGGWGWGPNWFNYSIYQNGGFFNRYGFGRYGGGFRGGVWAHNPEHRMGVAYPNSGLANRYAGVSRGAGFTGANRGGSFGNPGNPGNLGINGSGSRFTPQQSPSNSAQAGGWRRFGQPGPAAQGSAPATSQFRGSSAQPGYRSGQTNGGGGNYRAAPAYGNNGGGGAYRSSPSYNGGGSAPSYRASPSYGGGGAPGYRSSPSYGGAAPSYRSSPSFGGGGSAPSYRSSPSFGGGGGGSRGSFGGGGGGGGSRGGGGGSHGGGRR
jgi:hypothetical protein